MNKLQTIEWFSEEDEDKDWNTAEYEAYVQYHFQSFYEVEAGVYDRMKDVQGIDVPRLIAQVRLLEFRYSPYSSPEPTSKLFECPGIISGYIEGGILSIGRPKDKKNDDSVLLQEALEPHYQYSQ